MKIGIDANWAIYENAGIGKYTYNIIKALVEEDDKNDYVLFFNFFRHKAARQKVIHEMIKNAKRPVKVKISLLPAAWKEWLTKTPFPMKNFYNEKLDVFHAPFFAGVPRNGYENTVVTIHDLVFMRFPNHRGKKLSRYYLNRTKNAVEKASQIIAVSKATENDLVQLLKSDRNKINLVYEAADENYQRMDERSKVNSLLERMDLVPEQYILSVCTLEPRKNLSRLVKAYSLLPHSIKTKYKLVLTGKNGWNNKELINTINDLNLRDRIVMTGFVPQDELVVLYNGAALFAYPALYEGFGLPPLEAMACGAPVVTSNISSLPEVAGEAAVLVEPKKEEDIARAMKKILSDPELAGKLRNKGFEQAEKFSWKKAAQETIKVYSKAAAVKNIK